MEGKQALIRAVNKDNIDSIKLNIVFVFQQLFYYFSYAALKRRVLTDVVFWDIMDPAPVVQFNAGLFHFFSLSFNDIRVDRFLGASRIRVSYLDQHPLYVRVIFLGEEFRLAKLFGVHVGVVTDQNTFGKRSFIRRMKKSMDSRGINI